mgnify:CR=1 FL=1
MIKIYKYGEVSNDEIFARDNIASNVEGVVTGIIADVIANGDKALYAYAKKFDKADLTSLEVTPEEIDEAVASVAPEFLDILREAAVNIRAFHEKQVRGSFIISEKDGVVVGQKVTPIEKVGLYVPGGTAAYPSTVLMDAIPAKIAGCSEIVMVTPPSASGKVNPVILAAAKVAGVTRIFKMGGAQAIAALAYGTESVPRVDKIVGPGNAYVAEAKKQVFGRVSIDMIAGPSEILVVADATCNPKFVAADLLSQAEHDRMASAVLVTDTYELAEAVSAELERQIPLLPRAEIARESIDKNGKITAQYPGSTVITATMPSGQVSAVTLTVDPVKVSSVSISSSDRASVLPSRTARENSAMRASLSAFGVERPFFQSLKVELEIPVSFATLYVVVPFIERSCSKLT